MEKGSSVPHEVPQEIKPEEQVISGFSLLSLDEAFEEFDGPRGRREKMTFDLLSECDSGHNSMCQGFVDTIRDEKASIKARFDALDILMLSLSFAKRLRKQHVETIRSYITEATQKKSGQNYIVGMVFESVEHIDRMDNDKSVWYRYHHSSPEARCEEPADVIMKPVYERSDEEEGMLLLNIPNGRTSDRRYATGHQIRHWKKAEADVIAHQVVDSAKHDAAMQALDVHSKARSTRSFLEYIGTYVPAKKHPELRALVKSPGVNLTGEEYQAIQESGFMRYLQHYFDINWTQLTLREQVYAISYLKSITYHSRESSVCEKYMLEMKDDGLASFQVAAGGFKDFELMMRVLLAGREFEKKMLATFRSLAGAADRIQDMFATKKAHEFEAGLPSDDEVANLRDVMLQKGVRLFERYLRLFHRENPRAYADDLSEEELLDFIPVELGGRAMTPAEAERIMQQEIESVRVDAEVYAEFIIQQYKEDPGSVHEVLRTDFRTLTAEEIGSLEQRFISVYKANREQYITDELELAASILKFREKINQMKTDPLCPIHLQTFSFNDELIGFSAIEYIGDPVDKRIHITSFSLEPDVQHKIVGHAHIQKIVFDVYSDHTIEGEVHRNNPALLNLYVKRYGFEVTGTTTIDGKEFTTICRRPTKQQKDSIVT